MKTRNSHPRTEFYSTYKANKEKSIKFMQFSMNSNNYDSLLMD